MDIPHTTTVRNDTGLYNGKLGIWLFIASEAMLFGGLFSAYVFLRNGVPDWPHAADFLNVPLASINTFVLIASSVAAAAGWSALKKGSLRGFRISFLVTALLGVVFLTIKSYEYYEKISAGHYPSTNNFYGIYFVLTGVHIAHLLGGMLVVLYHAGPGARLWHTDPARFTNRIEVTGIYWHFVDLVWIVLFPMVYLT
jgi:heme/copper-type cytochrome/quinol oxidase subunit 3